MGLRWNALAEGKGIPRENPHRPARFPHARIRDWARRVSSPDRRNGFRTWESGDLQFPPDLASRRCSMPSSAYKTSLLRLLSWVAELAVRLHRQTCGERKIGLVKEGVGGGGELCRLAPNHGRPPGQIPQAGGRAGTPDVVVDRPGEQPQAGESGSHGGHLGSRHAETSCAVIAWPEVAFSATSSFPLTADVLDRWQACVERPVRRRNNRHFLITAAAIAWRCFRRQDCTPVQWFARRGDERDDAHVSPVPSAPSRLGLRGAKFLQPGQGFAMHGRLANQMLSGLAHNRRWDSNLPELNMELNSVPRCSIGFSASEVFLGRGRSLPLLWDVPSESMETLSGREMGKWQVERVKEKNPLEHQLPRRLHAATTTSCSKSQSAEPHKARAGTRQTGSFDNPSGSTGWDRGRTDKVAPVVNETRQRLPIVRCCSLLCRQTTSWNYNTSITRAEDWSGRYRRVTTNSPKLRLHKRRLNVCLDLLRPNQTHIITGPGIARTHLHYQQNGSGTVSLSKLAAFCIRRVPAGHAQMLKTLTRACCIRAYPCTEFAGDMLQRIDEDDNFLKQVVFSDEATFHVSDVLNRHNVRIWGSEHPHESYDELKQRIVAAIGTVDKRMLVLTWQELEYHFDVLRAAKGTHVEAY
ncbi:hypothetical protein PR048_019004 [Dryococelus australis]|uniref:Uncharacterized protein n=1 Tax=Dryococelus australis TaxID=614101 RepID=A0ABQ9H2C0_9NEOP|nr:hypothetical protein PR048_019004 [Dryococelus australis]